MSRFLYRLGGFAARHPWRVIAAWAAAAAVVLGLAGTFGGALNDDYTIPGTSSQRAYDLLRERVPGHVRRRRPGGRARPETAPSTRPTSRRPSSSWPASSTSPRSLPPSSARTAPPP